MIAGCAIAGVRAADLLRDVGVRLGEALDVRLVDDESAYSCCGGRSMPQSKNGLMTTDFGMLAAESSSLRLSLGSPKS